MDWPRSEGGDVHTVTCSHWRCSMDSSVASSSIPVSELAFALEPSGAMYVREGMLVSSLRGQA